MTYYILAKQFDGELVQVGTTPFEPVAGQILVVRDGEIPDLNKFQWHGGSLAFIETNQSRFLSKYSFLKRLKNEELVAIYSLAKTDINVEIWLDSFKMAEEICLDDHLLNSKFPLFELAGILAPGRAAEILA